MIAAGMDIGSVAERVPPQVIAAMEKSGITEFRPAQQKAIKAGLLEGKNLLVCTPTASGKTLIAEMAAGRAILQEKGKAIYIVPLVALASEKAKEFRRKYEGVMKIALSVGDFDSADPKLADYDLIVCTSEKLDSLIRHHVPWLGQVRAVIVDEVHLLNDVGRGPTMEILLTLLRSLLPQAQVVALSATIGNPNELADWLQAALVQDTWRPIPLYKGIYYSGEITFDN